MPPIVFAAAAVAGVGFCLLGWVLMSGRSTAAQRAAVGNLNRGLVPLRSVRIGAGGRPNSLQTLAQNLTPRGVVARLERLLSLAGRPPAWSMQRLIATKLAAAIVAAAIVLGLVVDSPSVGRVVALVVIAPLAYFVPDLLIYSRGQERQAAIELELPDTLDQMSIAVEAGLGFDAAMLRAGINGKGPLAEELVRTLQDVQLGQPRRDAYLELAERTTVLDLRRFLRAVIQADIYGVAVASVLRTQAGEMRLKRRQRAEEKAMQIPVKVIFPLMLCILPALFIVLLGPAVMDVLTAFR